MEELENMLCSLADDAIQMTETTFDMFPDTTLSECFPFHASRTIQIDGYNYRVQYKVELKPIE